VELGTIDNGKPAIYSHRADRARILDPRDHVMCFDIAQTGLLQTLPMTVFLVFIRIIDLFV